MPIQSGSHDEAALVRIMQAIPGTTFQADEIAADCDDCSTCVEVTQSCLSIHGIPIRDRLLVEGDLKLPDNLDLRRLPRLLAVTGNLDLSGCSNLALMPQELYVGGCADLSNTPIECLPEITIVEQCIQVNGCEHLARIHAGVTCKTLSALGATNLREISGDRDYETLILKGTAIEQLPPGLRVRQSLDLSDCRKLTQIAEGTVVEREVNVSGCCGLWQLPASLQPDNLTTDTMRVSNSSIYMPKVHQKDAEMMIGRPARDVIHHHLLDQLEVLGAVIENIRESIIVESDMHPTWVSLDTPTRRRLKATAARVLKRLKRR